MSSAPPGIEPISRDACRAPRPFVPVESKRNVQSIPRELRLSRSSPGRPLRDLAVGVGGDFHDLLERLLEPRILARPEHDLLGEEQSEVAELRGRAGPARAVAR